MSTYLDGIENGVWYFDGMVKEAYLGSDLVYLHSSGVDITYVVDTNVVYTEKIKNDTSILSPSSFTPTKTGYKFVGWREDTMARGNVMSESLATESKTLYAVFKKTVSVKYNANGGSGSTPDSTGDMYYNNGNILGATISLADNGFTAASAGMTFKTWAIGSADGTLYSVGESITLTENTTFYAVWAESGSVSFTTLSTYMKAGAPGEDASKGNWLQYDASKYFETGWNKPTGTNNGVAVVADPATGMIRVKCAKAISSLTITGSWKVTSLDSTCSVRLWVSKNGDSTSQLVYKNGGTGTSHNGTINYTFNNLAAGDYVGLIGWAGSSDDSSHRWSVVITGAKFTYSV